MKNPYSKKMFMSRQLHGDPLSIINDLQTTIEQDTHLPHRSLCRCKLCLSERFAVKKQQEQRTTKSNSVSIANKFKQILDGLTASGAKTLKLYLPDLFFIEGDGLEIYQTCKEGRITKIPGATPLKLLYPTMVRLRKQYKYLLQQNFNRKMIEKIDTNYMHTKYYDKIIPPHFHSGLDSPLLQANKHQFRRYVLHKNNQYEIASLEEHKVNQREPLCLVIYKDGNSQLLNQLEFEYLTIHSQHKVQEETLFFQSYIKYKKQSESIVYSEYHYDLVDLDHELNKKTETDVLILLGGIEKYDDDYKDMDMEEELDLELMIEQPKEYAQLMTYKIVHYLAMAARIYINHLKIKWIVNDVGTVYLQEILECATSEIPRRMVKYHLPRQDESLDLYDHSENFVKVFKDMKRRRALNTLIIKKEIDGKTYEELFDIINPETNNEPASQTIEKSHAKIKRISPPQKSIRMYQTIDVTSNTPRRKNKIKDASTYQEHLKEHPEVAMRNMQLCTLPSKRYSQERSDRVDNNINHHFLYHMSTQDKKILNSRASRSTNAKSGLQSYIQKKKEKVSNSLLYSTFSELNRLQMKQLSSLLQHQKISKKLQQSSAR